MLPSIDDVKAWGLVGGYLVTVAGMVLYLLFSAGDARADAVIGILTQVIVASLAALTVLGVAENTAKVIVQRGEMNVRRTEIDADKDKSIARNGKSKENA